MLGHVDVGAGDQHAHVGDLAARGPHLLAVDDPLFAVLQGLRAEACEVRTCAGLGEELAPCGLAGHDVGEVGVLLLTGAVGGDGRTSEEEAEATGCPEGAELGDGLLDAHGVLTAEALAVAVGRVARCCPSRHAEEFPPLANGEVRVPVGSQPLGQFLDNLSRRRHQGLQFGTGVHSSWALASLCRPRGVGQERCGRRTARCRAQGPRSSTGRSCHRWRSA